MISWIIKQVVALGYRRQNRGDFDGLVRMFAPDGLLEFQGPTPFGGERRGRQEIRGWFEQVRREFGRLTLTAHEVTVSGPPWNMHVIVRFRDCYELLTGETLTNHGFQYMRIAWGKIKEDRILVNLDIVHEALDLLNAGQQHPAKT